MNWEELNDRTADMDIEELKKIVNNYIGLRCKIDENRDVILYANSWTVIVDAYKWVINKIF